MKGAFVNLTFVLASPGDEGMLEPLDASAGMLLSLVACPK
jgi:hypothetical protein